MFPPTRYATDSEGANAETSYSDLQSRPVAASPDGLHRDPRKAEVSRFTTASGHASGFADQFDETRVDFVPLSFVSKAKVARRRLADFVALAKPRVMLLAVFTALVGLNSAPGDRDPLLVLVAILAIAAGAGAAGVLNMWYDADIDALMTRTAMRPVPRGRVSPAEALAFGLLLAGSAILLLALVTNLAAAGLLAGAILFYAVVYTVWLKRYTRHNIVIGGAAGALPPIIGWTAATGDVGLEPLVLFVIIFLWTPPHFWALALNRISEYARAGVPMLPVVAGRAETTRQILVYSALLVPASALPWALGFAGSAYGAIAAICGTILMILALQLSRSREADRRSANRLFVFSIFYLFVLFASLLVDHANDRRLPIPRTAMIGRLSQHFGQARPLKIRRIELQDCRLGRWLFLELDSSMA